MSARNSKRMVLIAGAVIILSGFAYLIYGGIGSNIVYFVTTGELVAKGNDAYDQQVRLGGMVVPGTVKWNAEALDLRFVMTDGKGTRPRCIPARRRRRCSRKGRASSSKGSSLGAACSSRTT